MDFSGFPFHKVIELPAGRSAAGATIEVETGASHLCHAIHCVVLDAGGADAASLLNAHGDIVATFDPPDGDRLRRVRAPFWVTGRPMPRPPIMPDGHPVYITLLRPERLSGRTATVGVALATTPTFAPVDPEHVVLRSTEYLPGHFPDYSISAVVDLQAGEHHVRALSHVTQRNHAVHGVSVKLLQGPAACRTALLRGRLKVDIQNERDETPIFQAESDYQNARLLRRAELIDVSLAVALPEPALIGVCVRSTVLYP